MEDADAVSGSRPSAYTARQNVDDDADKYSDNSTNLTVHIGWPRMRYSNVVRIVCVGETHLYGTNIYTSGSRGQDPSKIPYGDIYLHTGNFCDYYGNGAAEFAEYLMRLPHKYKVVILGEHDPKYSVSILRATTTAIVLDSSRGATTLVAGISIHATTHLHSVVRGALTYNSCRVSPITCSRDIVVSAVPPQGIFDIRPARSDKNGSTYLREQLELHPPRVCVFGGAPSDGGVKYIGNTLYANVGQYYHSAGSKIKYGIPIVIDMWDNKK